MQYENEDWVKSALDRHQEVGCNLDQDPSFVEHGGSILPVVLASISNMRPDDSLNIMLFFVFVGSGVWEGSDRTRDVRIFVLRYGMLRERVMHPHELLLAQGVPVYPTTARSAGFGTVPVDFEGLSHAQLRRMAGNSFNQACSNGFLTYIMASLRRKTQ